MRQGTGKRIKVDRCPIPISSIFENVESTHTIFVIASYSRLTLMTHGVIIKS
jgi:hypothetical protein